MRVLIVEDEMVSRKKLQRMVATFAECETAETGADALASFDDSWNMGLPFDLACLDILLPDMTGIEVLEKIRSKEKELAVESEARLKVIMVTAQSDNAMVAKSIQAGCDDYIIKPINRELLIDKIEHLFRDPLLPEARVIKIPE